MKPMNMGWKPLSSDQRKAVARRRDKALGLSEKRRAKQKYQSKFAKAFSKRKPPKKYKPWRGKDGMPF